MINSDAAAADIGAREIHVAVPPERDEAPVRCFATFTGELIKLVAWLKNLRITTMAMEATGVYWIPLAELPEQTGIEVCLVKPAESSHSWGAQGRHIHPAVFAR